MIFNNADNIMYGEKEVDRVFYGKNLVWERGSFYWISDRQTQSICGYKGVPTTPVCYLNWNQKPTNVSRPFPENSISVGDKSYGYNIFGERIDWNLYDEYYGFYQVCVFNGVEESPYRNIFANTQLLVNYNSIDDKSYCNKVGDMSFTYATLGQLTFQNCKIKEIGRRAFAHFSCGKSGTLILGDDETNTCTIGRQAFWYTDWDLKIVFDCSKIIWAYYCYPFAYSNISEVIFSKDVEEMYIPTRAFYHCENLQNIVFVQGITEIYNEAFYRCDSLIDLALPEGIAKIENNFYQCSKLANVILPESLIEIGEKFLSNTNIESIFIPKNVSKIDKTAFIQTTKTSGWESSENIYRVFKSFSVSPENPYFAESDGILYNKDFTSLYKVPCGKFNEYEIQFNDYTHGNNSQVDTDTPVIYEFPTTLKRVEDCCMYNVTGGNYVFILPDSVEYVGTLGFAGSYLNFNGYVYLGSEYLRLYTWINIPSNVKEIGDCAYGSSSNSTISVIGNIPDSVESIGKYAFCGAKFYNSYLNNDEVDIIPHIPENSKFSTIPDGCFEDCENFNGANIEIPNNVKSIKNFAFAGCLLSSVIIPKSVVEIGDMSFYSYRGFPLFYIYHDSYGENYVKYIAEKYAPKGYTITYEYLD